MRLSQSCLLLTSVIAASCGGTPSTDVVRVSHGQAVAPPVPEAVVPPVEVDRATHDRSMLDRVTMVADASGLCVLLDGHVSCLLGAEVATMVRWEGPFELRGPPYADVAASDGRACGCTASGETLCTAPATNARERDWTPWGELATIDVPDCRAVEVDCVLTRDRRVSCWGVAVSTRTASEGPELARSSDQPAGLVHGLDHVEALYGTSRSYCALVRDGEAHPALRCWGDNRYGQLSNGPLVEGVVHVAIEVEAEQVILSDHGSCATTTAGATCWGGGPLLSAAERAACNDAIRALALGGAGGAPAEPVVLPAACSVPPRPLEGASHFRDIAIHAPEVCAVDDHDQLLSWAAQQTHLRPHLLADHIVAVELGEGGCVLNDVGEIWCWGAMSVIGGRAPEGMIERYPGRRVARVTREGLAACEEGADTDPCDSDHHILRIDGPTELL